jgi:tRNA-Thr(GGU) m(6)t(6)A37 methyltransferase TsaA
MNDKKIVFHPIGVISTPFKKLSEIPIQPVFAKGIKGTVTIEPSYTDGLRDLNGFSHIYLFYCFHKWKEMKLIVKPYLENKEHGVFATRAVSRPNPLGFSLVKLVSIEKSELRIEDVDILNGTPLIDIKPYIKRFDSRKDVRSGWQNCIDDTVANARGRRTFEDCNDT